MIRYSKNDNAWQNLLCETKRKRYTKRGRGSGKNKKTEVFYQSYL